MKRRTFWLIAVAVLTGHVAVTVSTTRYTTAPEAAPMLGETVAAASNTWAPVTRRTGATRVQAPGASSAPEESKYTLKVPGGLAFSEFRGYEDWAVVAVHHTEALIKAVVGNPVAMDAFRSGIPGNGKPFPDGAKLAKVEWTKGSNAVREAVIVASTPAGSAALDEESVAASPSTRVAFMESNGASTGLWHGPDTEEQMTPWPLDRRLEPPTGAPDGSR